MYILYKWKRRDKVSVTINNVIKKIIFTGLQYNILINNISNRPTQFGLIFISKLRLRLVTEFNMTLHELYIIV